MRRVSVDIGGTFTDCFLAFDGKYIESKSLTTHHNLASGFMEALNKACAEIELELDEVLKSVDAVRYGTTLGTNALIQRNGPRVGVLTTAGFESSVPWVQLMPKIHYPCIFHAIELFLLMGA